MVPDAAKGGFEIWVYFPEKDLSRLERELSGIGASIHSINEIPLPEDGRIKRYFLGKRKEDLRRKDLKNISIVFDEGFNGNTVEVYKRIKNIFPKYGVTPYQLVIAEGAGQENFKKEELFLEALRKADEKGEYFGMPYIH